MTEVITKLVGFSVAKKLRLMKTARALLMSGIVNRSRNEERGNRRSYLLIEQGSRSAKVTPIVSRAGTGLPPVWC